MYTTESYIYKTGQTAEVRQSGNYGRRYMGWTKSYVPENLMIIPQLP